MTTEISIERLARVFLLNNLCLPDPDPKMSVEDVLGLYAGTYPVLEHATAGAPQVVGDELHYNIETPPVTTKG